MADTPPGMKIIFDEKNMTKWEVMMDGPEESYYAVCSCRPWARMLANRS
jgi:ubiquitin-protein ligase